MVKLIQDTQDTSTHSQPNSHSANETVIIHFIQRFRHSTVNLSLVWGPPTILCYLTKVQWQTATADDVVPLSGFKSNPFLHCYTLKFCYCPLEAAEFSRQHHDDLLPDSRQIQSASQIRSERWSDHSFIWKWPNWIFGSIHDQTNSICMFSLISWLYSSNHFI